MYEIINEPVEVFVGFFKEKLRPLVFRWRNKKYAINKVNLVYISYEGKNKIYYFFVSNNVNYFKLCFNTESLNWKLMELYNGTVTTQKPIWRQSHYSH